MFLESLPSRTAKLLEGAGITTAVAALQAGKDGLTAVSGIGEATADAILAAANAAVTGEDAPAIEEITPNEPEPAVEPTPAPAVKPAPKTAVAEHARPAEVVIRLNTLSTAVVNGRVIYQNEARRVPYAHYEQAVREYPGAWLVRFHRDGEFGVA